jgi:ABC-type transport system substrate-binding protein
MSELKKFEKLFTEGKITRREFMAKVSALGLVAAVSPALLSKRAEAATPKKGGHFKMGLTGGHTTDNLDPATLSDEWNYNTNWMFRNCLVEVDYKGNPTPELAESWEASKDAATWTFKLRKGVEFHNGKSLDAEDVIYSINHHRGKDSKSAAKGIVDPITDIKADGYWEVVWLKEPWVMCYWNGRQTIDWMFSTAYSGDAKWNDTHWKHERFDKLLKEARSELDENKRAEMYFETQKICRDEGGAVVHMFADWVLGVSKKCQYVNVAGDWNPDGAHAAERWWFA